MLSRVVKSMYLAQERVIRDLHQQGSFVAGSRCTLPIRPNTVTRKAQGRSRRLSSQKEPCRSRALPPAQLCDKRRLGTSVPLLNVLAVGLAIHELNSDCRQCQRSSLPEVSLLGWAQAASLTYRALQRQPVLLPVAQRATSVGDISQAALPQAEPCTCTWMGENSTCARLGRWCCCMWRPR